jgi:hypothetical protein
VRNGEHEFALPHFFAEMANDDLLFVAKGAEVYSKV